MKVQCEVWGKMWDKYEMLKGENVKSGKVEKWNSWKMENWKMKIGEGKMEK